MIDLDSYSGGIKYETANDTYHIWHGSLFERL